MLIMQLYPWISVREVSTDEVADTSVSEASAEETAGGIAEQQPESKPQKKSFWKRLFSK